MERLRVPLEAAPDARELAPDPLGRVRDLARVRHTRSSKMSSPSTMSAVGVEAERLDDAQRRRGVRPDARLNFGKVVLYQLSYSREREKKSNDATN